MSEIKKMLFHRIFRGLTGGHLKVWHYFRYVRQSNLYRPEIFFSNRTNFGEPNPWWNDGEYFAKSWQPKEADAFFLGGMDWKMIPEEFLQKGSRPVVNLIQHIRHSLPSDPRYSFLSKKAIRICVSPEVRDAIESTGQLKGPVFTIPNGISTEDFPAPDLLSEKRWDFMIAGLKRPLLASSLKAVLAPFRFKVRCLTRTVPRKEFLATIAASRVAILLPNPLEGFFLPAIEAMGLNVIVVCPDCVGNRSFCKDGINCFFPKPNLVDLASAAFRSIKLPEESRKSILDNARKTFEEHSLTKERDAFYEILLHIDDIW